MSKLPLDILDDRRREVWRQLGGLPKGGMLAGGTALALQIGHRRSYDFDVFYQKPIQKRWLLSLKKLFGNDLSRTVTDAVPDELTIIVSPDIKLTLLHFPFAPLHRSVVGGTLPMLDKRDVASAKAYAIGRRGAWRDYVDMYFLLRDHLDIASVVREAKKRFNGAFSEKLFLEQLQYFDDIKDFSLEFIGKPIKKETIQKALSTWGMDYARKRL